jgi:hypothetical protein
MDSIILVSHSEFFVLRESQMISNMNHILAEMSCGSLKNFEIKGSYEKAIVQVQVKGPFLLHSRQLLNIEKTGRDYWQRNFVSKVHHLPTFSF